MTGSTGRGVAAAVMTAGLLVLVWAAATGPARLFASSGRSVQIGSTELPSPTPSASPSATPSEAADRAFDTDGPTRDLSWIGDLILWIGILLLVLTAGRLLVWLWQRRWRPPPKPAERSFDVLPDVAAVSRALASETDSQLAAIREGTPRNAIVRCWLMLEEAAGEAGVPRAPWETSAEFTLRVLRTLDVDPRAIATLGGLYREARFSRHELGEDSRARAYTSLQQLHADLHRPVPARPEELP